MNRNYNAPPKQDTGWGLIFRLNALLTRIEQDADTGDIDQWDLHINRIYNNIIFKREGKLVRDSRGQVIDYELSQEDFEVFAMFNKRLAELKQDRNQARRNVNRTLLNKIDDDIFALISKKDMWIRKLMFKLKLYLDKKERDPHEALTGG